jgi:hypothetical protein
MFSEEEVSSMMQTIQARAQIQEVSSFCRVLLKRGRKEGCGRKGAGGRVREEGCGRKGAGGRVREEGAGGGCGRKGAGGRAREVREEG